MPQAVRHSLGTLSFQAAGLHREAWTPGSCALPHRPLGSAWGKPLPGAKVDHHFGPLTKSVAK